MWSIDGIECELPCNIERVAEMTASDISGLLLDKSYFNDVIGTYMKYTVTLAVPNTMRAEYNSFYEMLTQPVDGHAFVLPYGGGEIEITGRVTSMKDVYVRLPNNGVHWKGISFDIIANHPSKEMSLSQVLTRGAAALPDASDVNVGSSYEYTSGGWSELESAENTYY